MNKITLTTTVGLLLAALSPAQSHAGNNTWKGSSGGLWDTTTSGNWLSPLIWNNGDTALFGSNGGSPVNLGATVTSSGLTFTTPNYVIYSGTDGIDLNLTNGAAIVNNATNVSIAAQITGTNGLVYSGSGDLLLQGNTTGGSGTNAGSPNTYTGDTLVHGGTLLLQATNQTSQVGGNNLSNHGSTWAVSAIGAIDAGATVRLANYPLITGGTTNGIYGGVPSVTGGTTNGNFQVARGQIQENSHVILTGGTFDGNGDDNLQNYPAIIGYGKLVNSSQIARSVYKMSPLDNIQGRTITNSTTYGDPSPMTPSVISGKIAHEIDFDLGNSGLTVWLFNGTVLPTFGGSWRLSGSETLKFAGNAGLGNPNYFTTPNTFRMNGANPPSTLDLNGTSQTTGGFAGNGSSTGNSGQPNAIVCNGNPGTISILTVGAANLGFNALPAITTNGITYTPGSGSVTGIAFMDTTNGVNTDLTNGGILGITKVGTNIARFTGTFAISGPLTVSAGELDIIPGQGTGANPILNGPVYLSSGATLGLYTSSQNTVTVIPKLFINGVEMPNGTYGAIGNTAGATGIAQISNGGTPGGDVLQVVGYQPVLSIAKSGSNVVLSWTNVDGTFALQYKSGSIVGPWSFYPSSVSPVTIPVNQAGSMFFRLAGVNVWQNTANNGTWDTTSIDWSSPTIWNNGGAALFTDVGAGNITINGPITASAAIFTGTNGYTLTGNQSSTGSGSNDLVNMGPITVNTPLTIAATIAGNTGLTIQGNNTVTLVGDANYGGANIYSGPTVVKSGTVVLSSPGASIGGATYAIGDVTEVDPGATIIVGDTYTTNGVAVPTSVYNDTNFINLASNNLVTVVPVNNGQVAVQTFNNSGGYGGSTIGLLHLSGGTLDLNGDQNQYWPLPEGNGSIINSSPVVGASLTIFTDGKDHTFAGSIADGGSAYQTSGNSKEPYQIKIVDTHYGTSGGTWTLTGHNSYSGSTRIANCNIKLDGNGSLGEPSDTIPGLTGPMRLYSPWTLNLYGRDATVGNVITAGTPSATAQIFNGKPGTVSTFTFGKALETSYRNFAVGIADTIGGTNGGIVSLKFVGSSNNYPQTVTGNNSYSGDTILAGSGTLCFGAVYNVAITSGSGQAPSGISPNSAIRLTSGLGTLALNYNGTASIPALYVNGVKMPTGTYGANTPSNGWNGQPAPTIIGLGTLTVP